MGGLRKEGDGEGAEELGARRREGESVGFKQLGWISDLAQPRGFESDSKSKSRPDFFPQPLGFLAGVLSARSSSGPLIVPVTNHSKFQS